MPHKFTFYFLCSVFLLLLVGIGLQVYVVESWKRSDDDDTTFSYKRQMNSARLRKEEEKEKERIAGELVERIVAERGLDKDLQNADEKAKKLEMLKVQLEAMALVDLDTHDLFLSVLALTDDADEQVRISRELREISQRVRAIRGKLLRERCANTERYLEMLRTQGQTDATAPWKPDTSGFEDALAKFLSATSDEDRLRYAEKIKGFKRLGLGQTEMGRLAGLYDSASDLKMKHLVVGIFVEFESPVIWGKLLHVLSWEEDWTVREAICYGLVQNRVGLDPTQGAELLRLIPKEATPAIRALMVTLLGLSDAGLFANDLLVLAKNDLDDQARANALPFLDLGVPAHREHLLGVVCAKASYPEKKAAWRQLAATLDLTESGEMKADAEVYDALKQAMTNSADNDTRWWLMQEVLPYWPDPGIEEIVRVISEIEPDEDIREMAAALAVHYAEIRKSRKK